MCDKCSVCGSSRIVNVETNVNNHAYIQYKGTEYIGKIPDGINIGNKDHLDIDLCLDCGRVQGQFPAVEPNFSDGMQITQALTVRYAP